MDKNTRYANHYAGIKAVLFFYLYKRRERKSEKSLGDILPDVDIQ